MALAVVAASSSSALADSVREALLVYRRFCRGEAGEQHAEESTEPRAGPSGLAAQRAETPRQCLALQPAWLWHVRWQACLVCRPTLQSTSKQAPKKPDTGE